MRTVVSMAKYLTRSSCFYSRNGWVWALALAMAVFMSPDAALAAPSLGEMFCNAGHNVASLNKLFNGVAYIAGAITIGTGLLMLIKHPEDRNGTPIHRAIVRLVVGACLMLLPSFIGWGVRSIFGVPSGGGITSCNVGATIGSIGSDTTLDAMLVSFVDNIKNPMTFLLSAIAITMGVFFVVRGLMKASKFGTDPKAQPTAILANLIVGVVLFVVGQSLDVIVASVFGSSGIGGPSVISWSFAQSLGLSASGRFQSAVRAALTFVQLIGMISFIRGWVIMKNVAEGQAKETMAQGIIHVVGGVCAINIYYFLVAMDSTFGTGLL